MAQIEIGKLIYNITSRLDGKFQANLDKAEKSVTQVGKEMGNTTKATDISTKSFIKGALALEVLNRAYQVASGLVASMVKNASDLTESINAVNVVFGSGAQKVLDYGRNAATSVGLARSEYNQMATITGALLKDTGLTMDEVAEKTNDLAVRAADMASVFNTSVADAASAVNQAIRGETEAIRRYAGDVSDATLQTYLMSQGIDKNVTELTQQEKRLYRVDLIMAQTAVTAGDFANTSNSLANQQRILTARFKDTTAQIGTALIPALSNVIGAFVNTKEEAKDNSVALDSFGRTAFRFSNVLIVLGATISNLGAATKVAWNILQEAFVGGAGIVLGVMRGVTEALGGDTTTIDGAIKNLADQATLHLNDMGDAMETMKDNSAKIDEAMSQIWNPTNYKPIEETASAIDSVADSTFDVIAPADEASKELEKFTDALLNTRDEAIKTAEALNEELGESFSEFAKGIQENVAETNAGLADIVLEAEAKKKELKEALKNTDDKVERKDLKAQLKEVERVFEAEEGYEARKAEKIEAIRAKLAEAGIDATKAGLDSLTSVRTVEEEMEEKRRIAGLDAFTRFEEEQFKKLDIIVDAFVQENTLLQSKIATQKELEADLTAFMKTELSTRQNDIDAFVAVALAKYGEAAKSLDGLLSKQARLADLPNVLRGTSSTDRLSSLGIKTPDFTKSINSIQSQLKAPGASSTTNISPTVNINGAGVGGKMSATELSAILGFELNKYLR